MVLLPKVTNVTIVYGRTNMSKVKCSKCSKLAHLILKGEAYCAECAPKPTMPVIVERPKEWPESPSWKYPTARVVQKKPWWKRLFGL